MVRLIETSEAVRSVFSPWAVEGASIVTEFGGATVLLFLLSLLYWIGDRRNVATVVSYAFVALSVVLVLKTVLGMPRPPATVRAVPLSNDPFGFPSGHAVAAVVVYGGLATVYERREPPVLAAVAIAVSAIALSRVIIGVHYLGDVIAGVVLGTILLGVLWKTVGREPIYAFAAAAVSGLLAVGIGAPESAMALGGAVGGIGGSLVLDRLPSSQSMGARAGIAIVGVPVVFVIEEVTELTSSIPAAAAGYAVLVAVIFLLPLAADQLPTERVLDAGA